MARTRKQKRGVFSAIYRPIGKVIRAANSITAVTTKSVNKVVRTGLHAVNHVGKRAAARANSIVGRILPKRRSTRRRHH